MTPDERFPRWVNWIERVRNATHTLFLYRHIFQELGRITREADLPPSVAFDAFASWYATAQSVAIRRQVDTRRGTVSLKRLLRDVAAHYRVMSRQRHIAAWDTNDPHFVAEANANFDRFAGEGRAFIDPGAVRNDIARLDAAAATIKRYADEAVAHAAEDVAEEVPTWAELHAAIDVVGDLLQKYYSLLTASSIWQMLPVIQEDWLAPFRQPWIVEQ